ncbi:MAG: anti-sigma factor [Verrucomicrobiota bacterium]|jgi:anti-sigma factor RsiW
MICAEIRLLLHAHVDGELDAANSIELERHLKTCPACAAESESLRLLKTALQQASLAYRAPDSLRKIVRQNIRPPAGVSGSEPQPGRLSRLWLWKSLAFGATAFAVLAILLRPAGISQRDGLLNEAVASHVRSLMVGHLTDVASTDQHTVKPWFDGKLDFAPQVKDLAADGFPLVGGRLDYLNGRTVAALVYRHNKHFVNVFVCPANYAGIAQSGTENRRGYSVIYYDSNGMFYCLVSDLNAKELNDLGQLIAK